MRPAMLAMLLAGTVSGTAPAETRTGLLRYVSSSNSIPTTLETMSGSETDLASKEIHYIGSADVDGIRLLNFGWANGASAVQICPAYTIVEAWLIRVSNGQIVPITWGGATSRVVASGESQVLSDVILPSAFSLSVFPRGEKFMTAYHLSCGVGGKFPATSTTAGTQLQSGSCMAYDPATSTITNLTNTAQLGVSGLPRSARAGFSPVLLGTFASGDPIVPLGIGDSILHGVGATSKAGDAGGSFFFRSLWPTDKVLANPLAGCAAGLPGGFVDVWLRTADTSQDKLAALLQYANIYLDEYGINSIGSSGGQAEASALLAKNQALWALIRAQPVQAGARARRIARTSLLVKEDGAGQPAPGCGPGNILPLFNASAAALVGQANGPDTYIDCRGPVVASQVAGSVGNFQWGAGMGDTGAHPIEQGHTLVAAAGVRSWIQSGGF